MSNDIFLHIKKNFKIIDLLNLFDSEAKKNKYPDLSIYLKKNKFVGILTLGDLRRIRKKTSNLNKPAIKIRYIASKKLSLISPSIKLEVISKSFKVIANNISTIPTITPNGIDKISKIFILLSNKENRSFIFS